MFYSVDKADEVLRQYVDIPCVKTNKGVSIYNIPAAFDIETTSFTEGDEPRAIMYVWQFAIYDTVIIGRTWKEFSTFYTKLCTILGLSLHKRLFVYVHNLSFEFQFIRKRFKWSRVFALDELKPVQALTVDGVEFRCSYLLSGYSLAKIGDMLTKYPVEKKVGDLDYTLIRHSKTPLSEREIGYCINDVLVVTHFIRERIERDGDISRIPLTKTGYVRRYCRNACLYNSIKSHKKTGEYFNKFRFFMDELTITPDEYEQLKRAFQGGFTHASAFYSGRTVQDVQSFDFTSSYPAVMVSERFPMSKAKIVYPKNHEEFEKYLRCYCCIFDVEFYDLEPRIIWEHPLSESRCPICEKAQIDNGRVVKAAHLVTTLTDPDFIIISKFYKWKSMGIANFRIYTRGYLPKPFVESVLKLYEDKTVLKGVEEKQDEYLNSKEMLNSCYGMAVTDICRPKICYNGNEWNPPRKPNVKKEVDKYNKDKQRFLFYPWGVFVTAYARRNLFTAIYELQDDYIYADTDSVKFINADKHKEYFEGYNKMITEKIQRALTEQGIDPSKACPKTIKVVEKPLGVWDEDGHYSKFRTLGAKRYLVEKDGKISLTVSGVNKHVAVPYLLEKYGSNDAVFEAFNEGLYIPPDYTGKMTHTYIHDRVRGEIKDYTGIVAKYDELSGVHLKGAEYTLSLSREYENYLKGLRVI